MSIFFGLPFFFFFDQLLLFCVMCGASSEYVLHLLLHCSMFESLWNTLLDIFGEYWVRPRTLDQFLFTSFPSFPKEKKPNPYGNA